MCLSSPHEANVTLLSPTTSLYLWQSAVGRVGSEKENVCTVRHFGCVECGRGAKSEILIRNLKIQFNPVFRRIENKRANPRTTENQFPEFSM